MTNESGGGFALARGAARGFESLWPLLIPALLIGLAVAASLRAPAWIFFAIPVLLLGCWYLLVAKLPGQLRVRAIRKGLPDAIVLSVRVEGLEFARTSDGRKPLKSGHPRMGGIALVVTGSGVELWAGPVGNPAPARTLDWATISTVTPSTKRGAIAIVMTDTDRIVVRAMDDRPLHGMYLGRAARDHLVTRMLACEVRPPGLEPGTH